ncbi:alcohol dehydrogenase catalytic domain-containing protein [Rhizobium sp. NPDC090275]|uniref:alcohol dehydrogenase catalytic domain-containing protein n=1 Tax=Rhizobium sp. NPDC090275 TaxID=3364498 RepID=UPI00383A97EF
MSNEVGRRNSKLKVGDCVVVPFTISCGGWRQCERGHHSLRELSNPNCAKEAEQIGYLAAGLFGYWELNGRFPGGQAQYLRMPYADVGPIKVLDDWAPSKFCSSLISSQQDTWLRETATYNKGRPAPFLGCGPMGPFAINPRSFSVPSA